MIRKIFVSLLFLLSISLLTFSLLVLNLRRNLFNAKTYTTTLEQSGVYEYAEDEIKKNITESVDKSIDRENLSGQEEVSRLLIAAIAQQIDFKSLIQKTVEQNIINLTDWINYKEDTIYLYFPVDVLQQTTNTQNLSNLVENGLTDVLNLQNAPECTSAQIESIFNSQNINDLLNIDCKPTGLEDFLAQEFSDGNQNDNAVLDGIINNTGLDLKQKMPLQEFLENTQNDQTQDPQNVIDNLNNIKSINRTIGFTLYGIVFFGLLLALLAALLVKKSKLHKLRLFFVITFLSGFNVFIVSFIFNLLISQQVVDFATTKLNEIESFGEFNIDKEILIDRSILTVKTLIEQLFQSGLYVGGVICLISLLFIVVIQVLIVKNKRSITTPKLDNVK